MLFTINSANSQNQLDCKKFHVGVFQVMNHGVVDSEVRRTSKHQFEKYYEYNARCTFKIKWTSDCSYELKFMQGNKACEELISSEVITVVTIISVTDSSYVWEGTMQGYDFKSQGEMYFKGKE